MKKTGIRVLKRMRALLDAEKQMLRKEQDSISKTAWLRLKILARLLSGEPIDDVLMRRITEYVASAGEKQYLLEVDSLGVLRAPLLIRGVSLTALETVAELYHVKER